MTPDFVVTYKGEEYEGYQGQTSQYSEHDFPFSCYVRDDGEVKEILANKKLRHHAIEGVTVSRREGYVAARAVIRFVNPK